MADIHDQAMQWAQSNPSDPRAQDIMAKAWAAKNPQDPRSAQIMAKLSGQAPQSDAQPRSSIQAPDKTAPQMPRGAMQRDFADLEDMPQPIKNTTAKLAITAGAGPLAGMEAAGMGWLGRGSVNAGAMMLQKYLSNLIDQKQDRTQGVVGSGALGFGLSAGADALSGAAGKTADWLQQKAMGMKKYIPDVGTEAIEQGVRGSRDAMAGKLDSALGRLGDEAAGQVSTIPSQISSAEAASPVSDYASGMKVGDILPEHSAGDFAGATSRAEEIASRGDVSPTDAWELAKKAGLSGYKNQKALQSEAAQLAQLEQQGYSNALKKAYTEANPGSSALADTFGKMSRLYKAQGPVNADPTIRAGLPLNVLAAAGLGAAAGGAADHSLTGAAKGAALALALRNPAVQSYGAKGVSMFGNAAEGLSNPEVLQSLFGLSNANSSGQ